ncbi:hypothetical protein PM082_006160 [Marasmius tenuissimus]|nr:hypothetical protein PM082_006160 [Marasmius tenuissimus]
MMKPPSSSTTMPEEDCSGNTHTVPESLVPTVIDWSTHKVVKTKFTRSDGRKRVFFSKEEALAGNTIAKPPRSNGAPTKSKPTPVSTTYVSECFVSNQECSRLFYSEQRLQMIYERLTRELEQAEERSRQRRLLRSYAVHP